MGVGLALESLAHLVAGPSRRAVAVDHDDAVTRTQSSAGSRAALIGAADIYTLLAIDGAFHQIAADAAILTRADGHELIGFLGGNVLGIGVNVFKHRVDRILDGLLGIDGIHIECIQLFI